MIVSSYKNYIIAETGSNHDGDEKRALQLVDIAVDAGANAVKFQLFSPDSMVTEKAPMAHYQVKNLGEAEISQREMLRKFALSKEAMVKISQHCKERKIDFLCTPFDHESLDFLIKNTSMRYLKIASGEITNGDLLLAAARTGLPIILSTGMSNIYEIGEALNILYYGYNYNIGYPKNLYMITPLMLSYLFSKVTLLHCVSQYPASVSSINLKAIDTLKDIFDLRVGLSDHSLGVNMSIAAAARGSYMIEKHFTYDVNASGPEHSASLSPAILKELVMSIREIEKGLGDGKKICQPEEKDTQVAVRRSVVAAMPISKGEIFTEKNLTCKRPSNGGIAPNYFWNLLGRVAHHNYTEDDFIEVEELSAKLS